MFASSTACPADFQDVLLHLGLRLGDHFLDPRRMNSAVLDQLGQRQPGRLAADVVEGADDHHARRVVDDHVDAGAFLEGADVAALAADDPALHVVAGNVHGADGGVGGVLGGVAVDGGGQDAAGLLLAGLPQVLLVPLQAAGDRLGQLALEPLQQQRLGLLAAQAADLLQLLRLLLDLLVCLLRPPLDLGLPLRQLALAVLQGAFLLQQGLVLLLQPVLALVEPALLVAQLGAELVRLAVEFLALLVEVVLGLQFGFFKDLFGLRPCGGGDLGGAARTP